MLFQDYRIMVEIPEGRMLLFHQSFFMSRDERIYDWRPRNQVLVGLILGYTLYPGKRLAEEQWNSWLWNDRWTRITFRNQDVGLQPFIVH